ncbi:chalcone isomerase family protein [Ramlibacter sp.]|uniref:chalcone isomerase family protein n=1 Tax=Ramlibacter sp. TaxID=1917967 RepID=UPI002C5867A6|nr:chalcone isomerase family protein [Ramlibacter sp.]HWI81919.1 chalcone isomerase family protein [Ramlibacter sp.]
MKALATGLALAALLAAPGAWAQATVAGVRYEEAADLGGSRLALNGAGIRTKFLFKVYAAGLYLGKKAATAEEALALPGPKRIALTMLRDVDAAEFAQAFAKGMDDNNDKAVLAKVAPSMQRMNQLFADHKKLAPGDTVAIDWVPGTGTTIRVKGAAGEPLKDPDFFAAMLRIWLGPQPADASLKEALLGKAG